MPIVNAEQRVRRRVEFFFVPVDRERVPVWVFRPSDLAGAEVGLVLNVSDSGLQVLTGADAPLDAPSCELQLLIGDDESVPRFRGRAARVWTREADTSGYLSGLRFMEENSSAEQFIRTYQTVATGPSWVRCVLLPT